MTKLDVWLNEAVRHLSKDSASQVRSEIREHYGAELETALSDGADPEQAETRALQALGDPRDANCQYRKVLLSASEAALLRESNFEARAICSKPRLKWAFLAAPGVILLASTALLVMGNIDLARGLLVLGLLMAIAFIPPFLPIYTPSRGRVFRAIKWSVMIGSVALLFGRNALQWSWLLASCVFPIFWNEWKRIAIRRKLPVGHWPKQLYL
jgi:hypothetical protein